MKRLIALCVILCLGLFGGVALATHENVVERHTISTSTTETHNVRHGNKTTTLVDTDSWSTVLTDTDPLPHETTTQTTTQPPTTTEPPPTEPPTSTVIWSTGAENGYPGEWAHSPSSWDSGGGFTTQSSERKRTGNYSFKQHIVNGDSGTRLPRESEPSNNPALYYEAWYYIPQLPNFSWFQIMQWKGKYVSTSSTEVLWGIYFRRNADGTINLRLTDKSERFSTGVIRNHQQTIKTVPANQWFHLKAYYKGDHEPHTTARADSSNTGEVIVWQDGVEVFNMQDVVTAWSYDDPYAMPWRIHWTVNAYGEAVVPSNYVHYVDDVAISRP